MTDLRDQTIYARSRYPLGHGYPLWQSHSVDPTTTRNGGSWDMAVGDVGWIYDGGFRPMLRTSARTADEQPYLRLPDDYEPFDPPGPSVHKNAENVGRSMLSSSSAKDAEGALSVDAGKLPAGEPVGLCDPEGEASVRLRRFIINYVRRNAEKWEKFYEKAPGIGWTRLEDIVFVCGVVRKTQTPADALAARVVERRVEEGASCNLGFLKVNVRRRTRVSTITHGFAPLEAFPNPDMPKTQALHITAQQMMEMMMTNGASTRNADEVEAATGGRGSDEDPASDAAFPGEQGAGVQCVFFHYYKTRRKLPSSLWLPFEGDEPPATPTWPKYLCGSYISQRLDEKAIERELELMRPWDPVDDALAYIVKNSRAQVAIASDLDLYALFEPGQDFPKDVAKALARLKPKVDVDENGVGTLVLSGSGHALPWSNLKFRP
ncbi:hypothetical protein BV20DRAFT_354195 [Pilatotrama ljubarskyi]|nr:hypothetical protein BV20DRAFT_354195 [Pilatotrama ljubarskyi]